MSKNLLRKIRSASIVISGSHRKKIKLVGGVRYLQDQSKQKEPVRIGCQGNSDGSVHGLSYGN
nr:hypothetical protein [Parapedobacter tibetensis]